MSTYTCSGSPPVPGKEKERPAPKQISATDVIGRWTHHAYRISHDEKTVIVHLEDGIQVIQGEKRVRYTMNLRAHNPREFLFSPDSKQVVFWAPTNEEHPNKRIALMDMTRLPPGDPRYSIVYDPAHGVQPFGMEWSPAGDALFVIERVSESGIAYTQIQRLEMPSGGRPKLIVRVAGVIDFFMPPVSRFESSGKKSRAPYQIIFGAQDGLYLTDPHGRRQRRISKLPALGLHNIEWNPIEDKNQVVLFFRFPVRGPDGRKFQGVYLVDLDKMGDRPEDEDHFIEQLYEGVDIHTLWFSPKGTYVTWSSKSTLWFRRPEAAYDEVVELEVLDDEGRPLQMRGVTWNDDETRLAFTAENRVLVFDVERHLREQEEAAKAAAAGETAAAATEDEEEEELPPNPYPIAEFPRGFAAEPVWMGEEVFLTVVEDVTEERARIRRTPGLGTPNIPLDKRGRPVEDDDDRSRSGGSRSGGR